MPNDQPRSVMDLDRERYWRARSFVEQTLIDASCRACAGTGIVEVEETAQRAAGLAECGTCHGTGRPL